MGLPVGVLRGGGGGGSEGEEGSSSGPGVYIV